MKEIVIDHFAQILLVIAITVAAVALCQRRRLPSTLAYLLVGALVGPHALSLLSNNAEITALAEFGIVFLLFTIGLNFSLPQIYALRHLLLGLGTGQVVITTLVVTLLLWLAGLDGGAAFVVGAVVAQSSTTILSKQLAEQGEDQNRHGRLAIAMSVFQDVTAVPLLVIVPVLAMGESQPLTLPLLLALGKGGLAFALVYLVGRWLLRPLFHDVATHRSPELFTLTVFLVCLTAAWTTLQLGLSMALGAFLAGMILGETEFRHQIETSIRPFRDVLVGLFFVTIGMLLDLPLLPEILHWALLGAIALLVIKVLVVAPLVRSAAFDWPTAWRTAMALAVGGEFGFALLAIAAQHQVIEPQLAQIVLTSVLLSMVLGPFVIRYSGPFISRFHRPTPTTVELGPLPAAATEHCSSHVIICGYGRIGQNVARVLQEEEVPFVALDLDASRVNEARLAGDPVIYGDASDITLLQSVGLDRCRLLLISHDDIGAAEKTITQVRQTLPLLPIMVRTRDDQPVSQLLAAGASEVVPETVEAGLMIASQVLLLVEVPLVRVMRRMKTLRSERYQLLRELIPGSDPLWRTAIDDDARLLSVLLDSGSPALGHTLSSLPCNQEPLIVTAVVRDGHRYRPPASQIQLAAGDVLVLFGPTEQLDQAQRWLSAGAA
ncbi:MAG: cation:proton antiporter [Gammaproteobacteria bacterium]|nr:cation:proton antiporter [Gammaproteobacteria bacterium]